MLLVLQVWTCLEFFICSTWSNGTALVVFFNPVLNRFTGILTWVFLLDYRTCMEPRVSNIKTWKHESILLYFYSTYLTQCHFDSTSVAYKQSEEEDIQVEIWIWQDYRTSMESRVDNRNCSTNTRQVETCYKRHMKAR